MGNLFFTRFKQINMNEILFFSDDNLGHLIPTFPIARKLINHGYKLAYFGSDKVIEMADAMGFDTYKLFQKNPESQNLSKILC